MVVPPNTVVRHTPLVCTRCHAQLERLAATVVERRQVHDLPAVRLEVTEHKAEVVCCSACEALMHQGYMFYFVRMSEDSDPPVYGFCEGQSRTFPDRLYSQFSDFLAAMISDHDRIWHMIAREDC